MLFGSRTPPTLCGCWYSPGHIAGKQYLPLVDLRSHTTILATTSRTTLTQTFHNPSQQDNLDEVQYTFPLYDGVSVVSFKCTVAGRTIIGVVKEKQQARTDYQAAVNRGETAGLLEQVAEASDAHTTKIGNIPANENVTVEIEYLGELKHDAETDGSRFTIPTVIAPRYGSGPTSSQSSASGRGISISVDVIVDDGSIIRGIQSPSHPIAVTMGRTSTTTDEDAFDNHHASATLTLATTVLGKDFVIVVLAKGQDTPRALLETHPTIPHQRALMTTLVPKFNLPSIHPEIVFVVDRSGSMGGKIPTLVAALKVFLKSLPVSTKFNICSFGSHYEFMFPKSRTYDQSSLQEALDDVNGFSADFGGTEMYKAIEATFKNRLPGMHLEVLVLTDGEIWNQAELFNYIHESCINSPVRVFSLGIGSGASSSLVEGIARAGDGFAQFVDDNEKMDKRVVRMLKAALSPHIKDYSLEVKYAKTLDSMDEDDFEIVESVESGISKLVIEKSNTPSPEKKTISLFNIFSKETPTNTATGKYDHLPSIATPAIVQAPHKIPALYPFNRTTVYLLLGPDACQQTPSSVILRATSEHGPLELEIPVQNVGPGQTIHQLAAKKAVHEIEQGRGWLSAGSFKQKLVGTQYESRMDEFMEREAVRLGVEFQVGGKFCSFVAVEDGVEQVPIPQPDPAVVENSPPGMMSRGASSTSLRSRSKKMSFSPFGQTNIVPQAFAAAHSIFGSQPEAREGSQPRHRLASMAARRSTPDEGPVQCAYEAADYITTPPAMSDSVFGSAGSAYTRFGGAPSTTADRCSPSKPLTPGAGLFGSANPVRRKRCMAPTASAARYSTNMPLTTTAGLFASPPSAPARADNAPIPQEEKVDALIDLNNFDGSWAMSARLAHVIGAEWDVIKKWDRAEWTDTQRTTAVVIAFLEARLADQEDVWEMVVEKARDWLVKSRRNDVEEAINEIKMLLGRG